MNEDRLQPRAVFSVFPPLARTRYSALFDQLEEALSVQFSAGVDNAATGLVEIVGDATGIVARPGLPRLVLMYGEASGSARIADLTFTATYSSIVHRAFAGRTLPHRTLPFLEVAAARHWDVLAELGGLPVWARNGNTQIVSGAGVLEGTLSLRARLRGDTYLPLVALVQFVRRNDPLAWQAPSVKAAFLFDDPNLHSVRYGYVDFQEIASEARSRAFHVACAMIPLDGWFASRQAAALFREQSAQLSLVFHGNNHLRRELGETDPARLSALIHNALDRVSRFEKRHRLHVERVMAPPHGVCSFEAAKMLREFGFEALCVSRPYPWLDAAPAERPLAGWNPTEIVAGGLPVLPRVPFGTSELELATRAFLHQPIIMYGHHQDMADGPLVLRKAAAMIDSLGVTEWCSPRDILRTLYDVRRDGSLLFIRPHARQLIVEIPDGVSRVRVEIEAHFGQVRVAVGGSSRDKEGAFTVEPGASVSIELRGSDPALPRPRSRHSPYIHAYLRRGLTETRDRLQPLLAPQRRAA